MMLVIIRAMVSKDLLLALKNRMILTTVLMLALGIAFYFIVPSFMGNDDLPGLVVVGEVTDPLITELMNNPSMTLTLVKDQAEMEYVLGDNSAPLLGIASPIMLTTGENNLVLDAYMDHWVSADQVTSAENFFEAQLSNLAGQEVSLNIYHDRVYTTLSGSHPFNFTFPLIALLLFMGISVGPNLILEEKETKTLDMLLISPASIGQIITGKAFVAVLFGFIAALTLFLLNNQLVTHWGVALFAALCGALFTGSLGLLMGVLIKDRQQLIIWSQVVLIGLLLPIFIHAILQDTSVGSVLAFIPTVAIGKIVRVALSNDASIAVFIVELIWVLIVTGLLLFLIRWMMRRLQIEN